MLGRVDLPQFLDADPVGLRIAAFAQIEFGPQVLGQRTAAAFGKNRLPGVQFHPRLKAVRRLPVLAQPHVAGSHALDRAVLVIEDFSGGEAGIDFDAEGFGLLAQPTAEVAEADDVVTVIAHLRRRRQLERAAFAEIEQAVFSGRRVQRRTAFLPVGEELGQRTRFEHGAGQDVGTDFGALFQQTHRDFAAGLCSQLLDADRSGEPRRAAADDHDVVFHCIAISTHDASRLKPRPPVAARLRTGRRPGRSRRSGRSALPGPC